MQDEHPDRLKAPLMRKRGQGFVPVSWDEALDQRCGRDQPHPAAYGTDAFALLGGASLTNEKAYLMGKFARVWREDRQHRLQRAALHGLCRRRIQEDFWH